MEKKANPDPVQKALAKSPNLSTGMSPLSTTLLGSGIGALTGGGALAYLASQNKDKDTEDPGERRARIMREALLGAAGGAGIGAIPGAFKYLSSDDSYAKDPPIPGQIIDWLKETAEPATDLAPNKLGMGLHEGGGPTGGLPNALAYGSPLAAWWAMRRPGFGAKNWTFKGENLKASLGQLADGIDPDTKIGTMIREVLDNPKIDKAQIGRLRDAMKANFRPSDVFNAPTNGMQRLLAGGGAAQFDGSQNLAQNLLDDINAKSTGTSIKNPTNAPINVGGKKNPVQSTANLETHGPNSMYQGLSAAQSKAMVHNQLRVLGFSHGEIKAMFADAGQDIPSRFNPRYFKHFLAQQAQAARAKNNLTPDEMKGYLGKLQSLRNVGSLTALKSGIRNTTVGGLGLALPLGMAAGLNMVKAGPGDALPQGISPNESNDLWKMYATQYGLKEMAQQATDTKQKKFWEAQAKFHSETMMDEKDRRYVKNWFVNPDGMVDENGRRFRGITESGDGDGVRSYDQREKMVRYLLAPIIERYNQQYPTTP
jgi:hypothetical protein